ncbi:MAG TPA: Gfo/Idh/MocA family oxidoreductase, partial [Casimicrobiaceae bacterium]
MIRVGVVGAGLIGRRHIATAIASPDAELVGVADTLPADDPAVASLPCPYFRSHRDLLAQAKPDAVVIATPNRLHVPMGIDCARAGVAILLEKPVADTVEQACDLLREAKHANVPILVGHHRRHHAQAQEARRIIASGRLGTLVGVSLVWSTRKADAYFDATWRRTAGGGPILINLIHEIDMLRHLVGEIATVSGRSSRANRGFEVEDTAAAVLTFANGALGTILCSDAAASPWTIEQGLGESPSFPYSGENAYRIVGTAGALEFPVLRVWSYRDAAHANWNGPIAAEAVKTFDRDPYVEQVRHLRAVIEGRESPLVSGVDGTRTLAATLAVRASADRGVPVDLARDYAAI